MLSKFEPVAHEESFRSKRANLRENGAELESIEVRADGDGEKKGIAQLTAPFDLEDPVIEQLAS